MKNKIRDTFILPIIILINKILNLIIRKLERGDR